METLITTDAFEAYTHEKGIRIKELSNAARKIGILITVMGAVMLGVSFIPLRGLTADIIVDIFEAVFFWGGVILIPLGILTLVVKGMSNNGAEILIDREARTMVLRSKTIAFSEIDEFVAEAHDIARKKLGVLYYMSGGKKKAFVAGTFILKDARELNKFVEQLNEMLKEEA